LLFIHGAGGTHRHWGYQLQGLKKANRYAVDLPGHGRSEGSGQTSIKGYAELILQFLNNVGLAEVTLVGHSMGGAIAQYLALEHARRVERLVLVGTGARLRVLPSFLEGLLNDFPATVEAMLGWAYSSETPDSVIRVGQEEWLDNDPQVVHDDFAACDEFDVMGRLSEVKCPTLVVCGEVDRLSPPKYAHFLKDNIPRARLALVPHAGHMVMLERPEVVNQAIEQFLSATGG